MGLFFDSDEEKARKRELKEEAKEYREQAKEYLDDAREYLDDYKDYKSSAKDYAQFLSETLNEYTKEKVEILKELNSNISVTITNFKNYNIRGHVPKAPSINSAPSIPNFTVSNFMSVIPGGNLNPINIALSVFSNPEKDRDEARRKAREAERYCDKVARARTQMIDARDAIKNTFEYICEERSVIRELMGKLRSIIKQLDEAMKQQTHTEESAKYTEGICKIAEQIKCTLENGVTNNAGELYDDYKIYSQRIREINNSIPAAPSLGSSSSWLDIVMKY
jgi:uncharacterized coiled-coil DUF342 family protein